MRDMVAKNLLLRAPERGTHGGELRDDIDAITVVLDHARQPAHLAFDAFEALEHRRLGIRSHATYIPLGGNGFKAKIRGASDSLAKRSADRNRSGVRYAGQARQDIPPLRARRTYILLLLRRVPPQVHRRP